MAPRSIGLRPGLRALSPAELARISASRDGGPWRRDGRPLGEVNGRRLCVTWPRRLPAEPAIAAAAAALMEHGDSFSITASYGVIVLPHDSRDAAAALAHRRLRWRHVDPRLRRRSGRPGAASLGPERTCDAGKEARPQLEPSGAAKVKQVHAVTRGRLLMSKARAVASGHGPDLDDE